ncbi:XRE family transcriptional regulator [Acuticoccus sp. I52.16.1]|uniref:XRE family transcriptional regulator n=1 Tax=Acuticoccus sp. I52.16.1 TaxID=2928472 RepID=UPI001FD3C329|nr:XRE family transcriptional regulator [Acuticoccus sp. I52.16.1]UOM36186.1 short-chain fatty acyl-CoA regulator family protein [Acuticoccus sp. I52.16.1]
MSDIDARRKLFLGPQIRKLRRSLKLTQAQMAEGLEISASYLTLIERNQRPLTAQLILRLADAYDIDVRTLAPSTDSSTLLALQEVAADPQLAGADLSHHELQEMAEMFPRAADALVRLHEGLRAAREDAEALAETAAEGALPGLGTSPVEETREALQARDNYFPELEQVAADFATRNKVRLDLPQALTTSLVNHLKDAHNVDTVIMPYDVMHGLLRRFDRHRNRLMLSELLTPSSRTFQVAHLVGQLEAGELVRAMANDPRCTSDSSRGILRLTLGNYLAAAIMFPYDRFLEAAERLRYDVEVLASRFAASFEQVAHRLTTLRRPGAKGVPFFMIRVDRAGNISKRFGGGVFPFARSGGTCPRWRLYEAFRTPGRTVVDLAALPEGQAFLTIARTTERAGAGAHNPGQELVVGLGAEVTHAGRLVYADGLDLSAKGRANVATPIGVNCRLCPRETCNWRAFPPLTGRLVVDVTRRSVTPYHFVRS